MSDKPFNFTRVPGQRRHRNKDKPEVTFGWPKLTITFSSAAIRDIGLSRFSCAYIHQDAAACRLAFEFHNTEDNFSHSIPLPEKRKRKNTYRAISATTLGQDTPWLADVLAGLSAEMRKFPLKKGPDELWYVDMERPNEIAPVQPKMRDSRIPPPKLQNEIPRTTGKPELSLEEREQLFQLWLKDFK